jgi:hypothetical protein
MRARVRLAAVGLAAVLMAGLVSRAADDPAALLKPVTPGGSVRVRFPVTPGFPNPMTFSAQVPKAKKKSELVDIKVAFETLPGKSYVTAKKLESWGYDVGKLKEYFLPELYISATQLSPKPSKGADVTFKMLNVKLEVVHDAASKDDTIHQADISISSTTMFGTAERAVEPRVSFGDKFIEMTIPPANVVKRPGTDAVMAPDVTASQDTKLQPSVGTMVVRGFPVFTWASVDGQDAYKTPDGKMVPVNVGVSSISNMPSGVMVTLGLARGVKMEFDDAAAGVAAVGVETKSAFVPGKIKELRLEFAIGAKKEKKDLVVKDIPVYVDKNISEGYVLIGQKFMDAYVTDAVYHNAGEGWRLSGRLSPDLLSDIKNRPKKP